MFSNKHYVQIDAQSRIVDGWSDELHPERDPATGVCIHEQEGGQFRLFEGGEENPPLFEKGIPLYKLVEGIVVQRSQTEIEADISAIPAPALSVGEQLKIVLDVLSAYPEMKASLESAGITILS